MMHSRANILQTSDAHKDCLSQATTWLTVRGPSLCPWQLLCKRPRGRDILDHRAVADARPPSEHIRSTQRGLELSSNASLTCMSGKRQSLGAL
eukprot:8076929-Alexandrium_andersonii.AAC.2